MLDLNNLRVFEKVASLKSFSAAARALGLPKSNVSRGVARLEEDLGARLLQRTTRAVVLTPIGEALLARCADIIDQVSDAVDHVGTLAASSCGRLKVTAGVGFGINVLAEQLPEFLRRYPEIDVTLDLTSSQTDLVAENVDVAIRLGPMPDSSLVATRLGVIKRYLCAAPAYLKRMTVPERIEDLARHHAIEMPGRDGRNRSWTFTRDGASVNVEPSMRVRVNEVLTIHRLVLHGTGLGILSGYLCEPEIDAGRLVRVLPEWVAAPVDVSIVFPSRREMSPTVRAFSDFMKEVSAPGRLWLKDTL